MTPTETRPGPCAGTAWPRGPGARPGRGVLVAALCLLAACGLNGNYRDTAVPMESVSRLDTAAYAGLWYEIARFPNRFERDCTGVTAEYTLREDGRIGVKNSCRKGALDGPLEVAEGSARVAAPGQLKVKFAEWLPFEGDYWVLDVTEDYDVAVIGVPSGDFGWILARTPTLEADDLAAALSVLRDAGYDTDRLTYTLQPN
ncbi:MAG: lipocalin family protein [Pseudomonadota bacterium]